MNPVDFIFMALCLWREARGEPLEAKLGVAFVILNRVLRGGWWGSDVLSVVTKPWQFTGMTGKGDPNLIKFPKKGSPDWEDCLKAAEDVLVGKLPDITGGAVYYHDVSIGLPKSWGEVEFTVQIGRLKFYKGR